MYDFTNRFRRVCTLALLGLLVACAAPDQARFEAKTDWAEAENVVAAGYRGIIEKYIEPLEVRQVAMDGMNGLATIDPSVRVQSSAASVILMHKGRQILSAEAPDEADIEQWARLTVELATKARAYSSDLRAANSEKLYEAVFDGVLSKLDLFSRYAGAEGARRNRARRDGYGGIGIQFKVKTEGLYITAVTAHMPAAQSGIRVHDIVTHIDGKPVTGLSVRDVVSRVRGPTHTTVHLTVIRDGNPVPLEHQLTRAHIVSTTVTEKQLGNILYLKISSFNQDTSQSLSDKLQAAVARMGEQLKGVILDVRGNPGGLLRQSIKAADLFLTQGNIVTTKGRHADSVHVYEAGGRDVTGGLPMLLLIDGKSASAAEIVAVALQDRERAVLVGTSSYGKGTVQTVLRLPNDGEITLTWSRLIAPSGYTLHGLGVRPEVCIGDAAANIAELVDSILEARLSARTIYNQWRTSGMQDESRRKQLRDSCPAGQPSSETELSVARHLIEHPRAYASALTLSIEPHQARN